MTRETLATNPRQARSVGFFDLQEHVVESAISVFDSFDVGVTYVVGDTSASLKGSAVMAIVGYASASVSGGVLLLASRVFVDALMPDGLRRRHGASEIALRDVLGEFANMVAGRLKNRLAMHDLDPLLTPPTTVFGDELSLPAPVSGLSAWHRFETGNGNLFMRFDAAFDATFRLSPADESKRPTIREGELVLWEMDQ